MNLKLKLKFGGPSPEKLIERLLDSEIGRNLAAEITAEQVAERQGFVAEIEAARAEEAAQMPAITAAVEKAEKRLAEAEAAAKAARTALVEAQSARTSVSFQAQLRIQRGEAGLRETAPAVIDDLRWELERMFQGSRHWAAPDPMFKTDFLGRQKQISRTETTAPRMAAIRAAMHETIHVLPYLALTGEELNTRLAQIRASIAAMPVWSDTPRTTAQAAE